MFYLNLAKINFAFKYTILQSIRLEQFLKGKTVRLLASKEGEMQEGQKSTISGCNESFSTNIASVSNPLIKTNPERFLVTMSHNGPTNQLMGLRDAIFLSICLNRTLVLPKFYKVKIEDPDGDDTVPAESRIDIKALSKLIPFHRSDKLHLLCKDGIDQLITGRDCGFVENRVATVKKVVNDLHMPYPVTKDKKPYFICANHSRSFDQILENHNSSHKCIAFSFYGLGLSASQRGVRQAKKMLDSVGETDEARSTLPDLKDMSIVYSLGFIATGLPSIVKTLASKFANDFMNGKPWLAIHWRYNPVDWMAHCKPVKQSEVDSNTNAYSDTCNKIENVNATDILHAGVNVMDSVKKKIDENLQTIYFATPLNQKDLISEFESECTKLRKESRKDLTVLTSTTLKAFLDDHADCMTMKDNNVLKDTLALVEMELCIQSTVFLYSVKSSWSANVLKERKSNEHFRLDNSILSLAWREHIKT